MDLEQTFIELIKEGRKDELIDLIDRHPELLNSKRREGGCTGSFGDVLQ